MESVPAVFPEQPSKEVMFKQDATLMVDPRVGGGTGRFMHSTPDGAMVDIKGIARELSTDDFSAPERDYEDPYQKGNDWFHASVKQDTIGTQRDKPEFRAGDLVKIADVYGSVIGPGFGVFIAYGTTGKDCILSFDNKEIVVPVENVAAVLEQDAKDNFSQTDNDGVLSPMSLGAQNVKIDKEEPAMDQRDEFSKWMSAVEEALSTEGVQELAEVVPDGGDCQCGSWDCSVCFPDPNAMNDQERNMMPVGPGMQEPAMGADEMEVELPLVDDEVDDFRAAGGKVTVGKYHEPRKSEKSFPGSAHIGGPGDKMKASRTGNAANTSGLPVVGMNQKPVDEEDQDFVEKPKSGKGVKLGDIVQKTEVRPTGGQKSPMTYGDDNLDEQPMMPDTTTDAYGKAGRYSQEHFGEVDEGDWYDPEMDDMQDPSPEDMDDAEQLDAQPPVAQQSQQPEMPQDNSEMMHSIIYMQDMGLSKASKSYRHSELAALSRDPAALRKVHGEVMGGTVDEATKPLKTKTKQDFTGFDDMDDILNPKPAHLPANISQPDDQDVDGPTGPATPSMPRANPADTRRKVGNMTPSDQMRDMMNRINPDVGADEPELPDQPTGEVVVRTAADVPAVISNAMMAAGEQMPEWHSVQDLPGFMQRNIRGMGRSVFSMFTRTPLEQIQTIANVDGQGPNSDAEMRAVGAWLRDNAEDLGKVDLSHGMAIPGYRPDVKEYRINGVRFHVVRDPVGQYIYAYPDQDSVLGGPPPMGGGQGRVGNGGGVPRLREGKADMADLIKFTLFEEIQLDEQVRTILESLDEAFGKPNAKERGARSQAGYEKRKSDAIDAGEEPPEAPKEGSQLARRVGKLPGGKLLIKWLHGRHRLDNEAELSPLKITNDKLHRPLWSEFKKNGNNFVIISAQSGVAAIKPYSKFINDRTAADAKKGKVYNPGNDSTVPYQIIAFTNDGEQIDPELLKPEVKDTEQGNRDGDPTVSKARMGRIAISDVQNSDNAFDMLTAQIGAIRTIWVTGVKQEPDDAEIGSINRQGWRVGAVPHDKMNARAELKKPPKGDNTKLAFPDRKTPYAPPAAAGGDPLSRVFDKVRPVLQPIVTKMYSKVSLALQDAVKNDNEADAERLLAARKIINDIKATLDTSGAVRMTPNITKVFSKALTHVTGHPMYTPEFNDAVDELLAGPIMGLEPVVRAVRKSLMGALR